MQPSTMAEARAVSPGTERLGAFIQQSLAQLQANRAATEGILFLGTWSDSIPRLLIRDPVLKPTEVRLWSVIRTLLEPSRPAVMPAHDTLASLCNVGSRTTIAGAIAVLRCTRWLSLCARIRDSGGRFAGHVYALHDEPTTLCDALYLDPGYVTYLHEMTVHAHARVQRIARGVLATIEDRVAVEEDVTRDAGLPLRAYERLRFLESLDTDNDGDVASPFAIAHRHQTALRSPTHRVQNLDTVPKQTSDRQNGRVDPVVEPKKADDRVQKKTDTVSCSSSSKQIYTKTTTTKDVHEIDHPTAWIWPDRLSPAERALVAGYFGGLAAATVQDVLDELAGRLRTAGGTPVRNPVGWLIGSCKRAAAGTFQLTSLGHAVRQARSRVMQLAAQDVATCAALEDQALGAADPTHPLVRKIEALRQKVRAQTASTAVPAGAKEGYG